MRVNINSNGLYSITSVDARTLNTIMFLLGHVKEQCFQEYDMESDKYYSGDGLTVALTSDELSRFQDFIDDFWCEYENIKEKFNLKK